MARSLLFWILGVAGFVASCEVAFRLLPVSTSTETGYYADPLIKTYPANHRWISSSGWDLRNAQSLSANNLGYAAHRDFKPNEQAVVLIGDSYVEASMLDARDRPGMQLEVALQGRPVYTMGLPGTALLDYAERIRYASENFAIKDYVVLMERFDVVQSLCGSGNINGPCLDSQTLAPRTEIAAEASTLKRWLRHSQFAQYLVGQIKLDGGRMMRQIRAQLPHAQNLPSPTPNGLVGHKDAGTGDSNRGVDAVTHAFFKRIQAYKKNKLVIIVDCDRAALYRGESASSVQRQRFMDQAASAGAIVIDAEPLLKRHWDIDQLKFDVSPTDGHLNRLGVEVLTMAAARAILLP